jgi:hypothetical protein
MFYSERGESVAVRAEPKLVRKKPGTVVPPDPDEPESDLPSWRKDVDELLLRTLDRPQDPPAAASAQSDRIIVRADRNRPDLEG